MAKKRLRIKDSSGNVVQYDVAASDVTLQDGTDVETAMAGLGAGTVKGVKMNGAEMPENDGVVDLGTVVTEHQSLAALFGKIAYDNSTHRINFYGKDDTSMTTVLGYIDCSPFIVDGMLADVDVKNVSISGVSTLCMVFSFNTDAGQQDINIPVSAIFDASQYYTKSQADGVFQVKLVSGTNIKTVNNESILGEGNISIPKGEDGDDGKSAYEIAVDNGFEGTEAEWVASLKGQKGDTGNVVVSDGVAQIGIINDLTTGGEGDALSAEMGKKLKALIDKMGIDIITIDDADLAFIDEDGNVAMKVAEGHVETANFDSRQVSTNTSAIQQLQSQIGQQGSAQTDVVVKEDADAAFDIADESGRVALRITSKGHIKTKGFDSENMDIFRATKLDSPQCICHGYGSATGHANTLAYFRNGIAKGYKFFEVDGVDCQDGVTVCTHAYESYSVKNKTTGETESIVLSEIDSTELLENYTWADDAPIATLKDVIWLICYFHRCPLHVDGQGMTKTSRYAASQYAESLGVGQYMFHEIPTPYTDWDIPCNVIMDAGSVSNIATQAARYKKANNNILFYFASNFYSTDEALKALADAAHENGCYLISWTFNNIDTIRNWFKQGADFLITSGIVNSQV